MALRRHTRASPPNRRNDSFSAAPRSPHAAAISPPKLNFSWAAAISKSEWSAYRDAIIALRNAGVDFLIGGGFALATFTARWRDTKDIDFYIRPRDRKAAMKALKNAGFADYYSKLKYDRKWIYRSIR